jgi:hypothetical protein
LLAYLNQYASLLMDGSTEYAVEYDLHLSVWLLIGGTVVGKLFVPYLQFRYPTTKGHLWMILINNAMVILVCVAYDLDSARSAAMLYTFLALSGVFTGGTVGLLFAVNGMATDNTHISTIIMTTGLFLGISLYPFLFAVMVETVSDSLAVVYVVSVLTSISVATLLVLVVPHVQYRPDHEYSSKPSTREERIDLLGRRRLEEEDSGTVS